MQLTLQIISFIIIGFLSIVLFFVFQEYFKIKSDYNNLKNRILDSFRDKLMVEDEVSILVILEDKKMNEILKPFYKATIKAIYGDDLSIHYEYNDPYIDGQLCYISKFDVYPPNWFE